MSMVYEGIVQAIEDFDFGNYGLDDVEFTKDDPTTRDWIYDLASKIKENISR